MDLDESFINKNQIAGSIRQQLAQDMSNYGYEIMSSLVTDLSPDAGVKRSMNEINASKRLKEAASHQADADKVKQVKAAEAEAEARYLSGVGVARQRTAIVSGLKGSIAEFEQQGEGRSERGRLGLFFSRTRCVFFRSFLQSTASRRKTLWTFYF
mmetsp:Transcript_1266/g.2581  ORF Transcript_1266/g.2581 Transcript_1266/m.2581 type:complete len:155 (-) Transcript_1266:261-725(-)